jgi:hypothetical protein
VIGDGELKEPVEIRQELDLKPAVGKRVHVSGVLNLDKTARIVLDNGKSIHLLSMDIDRRYSRERVDVVGILREKTEWSAREREWIRKGVSFGAISPPYFYLTDPETFEPNRDELNKKLNQVVTLRGELRIGAQHMLLYQGHTILLGTKVPNRNWNGKEIEITGVLEKNSEARPHERPVGGGFRPREKAPYFRIPSIKKVTSVDNPPLPESE